MGTTVYPLRQQMADNIAAHGLRWAVAYYAKHAKRTGIDWAGQRRMLVLAYTGQLPALA